MSQENIPLLHSRYNPQGEAERYIDALPLDGKTRFFILIEPGLGYMVAPLREKAPGAKIIALHAGVPSTAANPQTPLQPPDARWHPGAGMPVQDFLEREIPDTAAAEIRILEWRPALAVYGGAYRSLVEESAAFIKRSDANARTFNAFGKRWFRNFFKNLGIIRNVIRPAPLSLPILVAGAGPSLEEAIPLIKENVRHGSLFVLAVSSSAAALKAAGITPGMIISTDGWLWASFHLLDCFRGKSPQGSAPTFPCPLAAAMSAALPSQCAELPVLPISDGSLWQSLILKELKVPFASLPQRGTVSASALDLAFALTSGDIFIAGIDLANSDMRSHARPYSFDRFLEEKAARVNPVYSQAFKRSALLKAGGSYGIYASWFEKQLAAYPKRLYSLGKNNRVFSPLGTGFLSLTAGKRTPARTIRLGADEAIALDFAGNPARKACGVLEKALRNPAHAAALREELSPVLLGGRAGASSHDLDLIEALRSLAPSGGGEEGMLDG